jgi:hypothetical protein
MVADAVGSSAVVVLTVLREYQTKPVACQNSDRGFDQVFAGRVRLRAGAR